MGSRFSSSFALENPKITTSALIVTGSLLTGWLSDISPLDPMSKPSGKLSGKSTFIRSSFHGSMKLGERGGLAPGAWCPGRGRAAHAWVLALTSQPVLMGAARLPSPFCSRYSNSSLAKFRLIWSTGTRLEGALPPVWYPETSTSLMMTLKYSCCPLPALRQVSTALGMWVPLAQDSISLGDALFRLITKLKSFMLTLPAPPPPPLEEAPSWDSPQLQDTRSISPLCCLSADSPSIPSSLRKKSTAAMRMLS